MTGVAGEVGARLRAAREEAGLSLSELARQAGVGKATLSQIETGARNPTIETLYAVCGPLGLPLSSLIGQVEGARAQASGGMRSILLDLRRPVGGGTVEVFRLEFPAGAQHSSPAHGALVTEQLSVTQGCVRVVADGTHLVRAGETLAWASDRAHTYAAVGGVAEAVVVISTPADD